MQLFDRERRSIPMGTWGTSLYSGDFARDLRGTIRAVVRLPYDADRLAEIVCDTEPDAARNPGDEDHTTFWLVLGDQFARYGLKSDLVLATALEIIDSGRDLALQRTLGQTDAGLEKRRRVLADLRDRLTNPPTPAPRKLIHAPNRSCSPFDRVGVVDVGHSFRLNDVTP